MKVNIYDINSGIAVEVIEGQFDVSSHAGKTNVTIFLSDDVALKMANSIKDKLSIINKTGWTYSGTVKTSSSAPKQEEIIDANYPTDELFSEQ